MFFFVVAALGGAPSVLAIDVYPVEISRTDASGEELTITFSGHTENAQVTVTFISSNGMVEDSQVVYPDEHGFYRGSFGYPAAFRVGTNTIVADDALHDRVQFEVTNNPIPDPCLELDCIQEQIRGHDGVDTIKLFSKSVRLALIDAPVEGSAKYNEAQMFIKSTCKHGAILSYDIDNKQQGTALSVLAEVFCNKKSINKELIARGLATIDVNFCDKSEFSSRIWAQDCHSDALPDLTGGVRKEFADLGDDPVPDSGNIDSTTEDTPLVASINNLVGILIANPIVLVLLVVAVVTIPVVAWKKGKSRSRSSPQPPPSPTLSQNSGEPPTNQFYECPMCYNPNLAHNDSSQKHPQGWAQCKCGFKFDFAKKMEF